MPYSLFLNIFAFLFRTQNGSLQFNGCVDWLNLALFFEWGEHKALLALDILSLNFTCEIKSMVGSSKWALNGAFLQWATCSWLLAKWLRFNWRICAKSRGAALRSMVTTPREYGLALPMGPFTVEEEMHPENSRNQKTTNGGLGKVQNQRKLLPTRHGSSWLFNVAVE